MKEDFSHELKHDFLAEIPHARALSPDSVCKHARAIGRAQTHDEIPNLLHWLSLIHCFGPIFHSMVDLPMAHVASALPWANN